MEFGRALIMLPFLVDQGLVARFLEEKQAGVEVPRNEQDGSFTRDSVAETLTLVMKDEEEKIYWDKAKEMSTIFGDKDLQYQCIDKFVEFLERKPLTTAMSECVIINLPKVMQQGSKSYRKLISVVVAILPVQPSHFVFQPKMTQTDG